VNVTGKVMSTKERLDELLQSEVSDLRSQGAKLLRSLGEEELKLYFDGCDIDSQSRILGDLPWSDELLDVFLEFTSDSESILGLDLRGTGRLGHLTCLRRVPNLRYLDLGRQKVSFVNTEHWPLSLCRTGCRTLLERAGQTRRTLTSNHRIHCVIH
jgi:hypothetical protein